MNLIYLFIKNIYLYLLLICLFIPEVFAKKTNQAIYEDPFDQAAGGASLTRASKEGVMFSNPALMPYGQKFFRWFGLQNTILTNKESTDMAKAYILSKKEETNEKELEEKINSLFNTPIHFGVKNSLSLITDKFGIAAFTRFEPDIKAQKHDETGLPEIRAMAEGYAGAILSIPVYLSRFFALGVSAKYVMLSEPDIQISLSNQEKIQEFIEDPTALQKELSIKRYLNLDIGALLFWQTKRIDWRLALKADDLPTEPMYKNSFNFKNTFHIGLGFTLHNSIDALHISADWRDILNSYDETIYQKIYLGAKLLLKKRIGLACGYYQGFPTYGIRFELPLLSFGATAYGRELGKYIGHNSRTLYMVYFTIGY